MGLDMYAFKVPSSQVEDLGHVSACPPNAIEIITWRKHYSLAEWMEELYKLKGGNGAFCGKYLRLDRNDLTSLAERDFGCGSGRFVDEAKEAIENGWAIYYYHCW